MTHAAVTSPAKSSAPPAAVLFGLDSDGKAHSSSFLADEIDLARRAAALMGQSVLLIDDDERRSLAVRVPAGRVFASGKVFSPFVARPLFDQLCAAAGVTVAELATLRASSAAAKPVAVTPAPVSYDLPADRAAIKSGALVLATDGGLQAGWFESVVVDVEGDNLRLRWRDWPEEAEFLRHRDQLALLPRLAAEQP